MINRISTKIDLKIEDDIYEYEEMLNVKLNEHQAMFSPLQCEIEINLNNNFNDFSKSEMKLNSINNEMITNIKTGQANKLIVKR